MIKIRNKIYTNALRPYYLLDTILNTGWWIIIGRSPLRRITTLYWKVTRGVQPCCTGNTVLKRNFTLKNSAANVYSSFLSSLQTGEKMAPKLKWNWRQMDFTTNSDFFLMLNKMFCLNLLSSSLMCFRGFNFFWSTPIFNFWVFASWTAVSTEFLTSSCLFYCWIPTLDHFQPVFWCLFHQFWLVVITLVEVERTYRISQYTTMARTPPAWGPRGLGWSSSPWSSRPPGPSLSTRAPPPPPAVYCPHY